jgi:predicted nuclease with TOPRIM domain
LNQWKKKFLQNASLAFDMSRTTKEYREKIEKLEKENEALAKTLGKTTVERDWAVGKLKSLDLSSKRVLVDSKLDRVISPFPNPSKTISCSIFESFCLSSKSPRYLN